MMVSRYCFISFILIAFFFLKLSLWLLLLYCYHYYWWIYNSKRKRWVIIWYDYHFFYYINLCHSYQKKNCVIVFIYEKDDLYYLWVLSFSYRLIVKNVSFWHMVFHPSCWRYARMKDFVILFGCLTISFELLSAYRQLLHWQRGDFWPCKIHHTLYRGSKSSFEVHY